MARNRRHQSAAIRFGPALKAVVLCAVIGGSAVGYVWQKEQVRRLGDRIVRAENELDRIRAENRKLRERLAQMQSPASLEMLERQHNLGLVQPSPDQVMRLSEPASPVWATPPGSVEPRLAVNQPAGGWPPGR